MLALPFNSLEIARFFFETRGRTPEIGRGSHWLSSVTIVFHRVVGVPIGWAPVRPRFRPETPFTTVGFYDFQKAQLSF